MQSWRIPLACELPGGGTMRRREFITLIGGGVATFPFAARAQQSGQMGKVGILMPLAQTDHDGQSQVTAFKAGLQKLGRTEGRNLQIETRWTGGNANRLPILAKELADLRPDVILTRSTPAVAALLQATRTTPIVFVSVSDPIGDGLVTSFARPGGNVTGFTNIEASMSSKWVELLKETFPRVTRVGIMFNPNTAPRGGAYFLQPFEAAASSFGIESLAIRVKDPADIEPVIASLASGADSGLVIMSDIFTSVNNKLIVQLVEKYRLPAVYPFRFFATSGGLMSYGTDIIDLFRRAALYVDRILSGEKPGDLPVQNPTKFELVLNLKTAKALGLELPPVLLGRADEVIE
jgi:putative ABC transport system substrate-binding protein